MINLVRRTDNLLILKDSEDEKEITAIGVRCGLSWPLPENPGGYFCLVAQIATFLMTGEKPLRVIREFKAMTLTTLFEKMFNEMGILGCFEIFTDLSSRYDSYKTALALYMQSNRDLQRVRVKPAPYAEGRDGFIHGKNMLDKWLREIKGLTIPKEFGIHSELREIRESDLKGEPQEKFYAINALRYVLGAFETSAIPESTKNRVVTKGIPPGAWN